MAKIAETYIHLDLDATEVPSGQIKEFLSEVATATAKEIFFQNVSIEIEQEEGSWKVRVFVVGAIIFTFVVNYGSFRSGVDYIIRDARAFSEIVIDRFVQERPIESEAILRTERRLGLPGKMHRLFRQIDRIKAHANSYNDEHLSQEVAQIKKEIDTIAVQLAADPNDRDALENFLGPELREELNNLKSALESRMLFFSPYGQAILRSGESLPPDWTSVTDMGVLPSGKPDLHINLESGSIPHPNPRLVYRREEDEIEMFIEEIRRNCAP
ncbi:MAG: hypothetical protein O2807_01260 [bacterium]|nr:hypothetical protein [bacterium]